MEGVFTKGLAQISQQERKEIEQRWMPLQKKNLFENKYFWFGLLTLLLGLSIIIIVISIWNASLKKAVKEKTKALEVSTQELLYKTYHDELTGLYNRAYFSEILEEIQSKPLPLSIIVADLNCLKITNDTFGHAFGDLVISTMANELRNHFGPNDVVGRIGGDEFLVVSLNNENADISSLRERIQQQIRGEYHLGDVDLYYPGASLGIVEVDPETTDADSALHAADIAMYQEKKHKQKTPFVTHSALHS